MIATANVIHQFQSAEIVLLMPASSVMTATPQVEIAVVRPVSLSGQEAPVRMGCIATVKRPVTIRDHARQVHLLTAVMGLRVRMMLVTKAADHVLVPQMTTTVVMTVSSATGMNFVIPKIIVLQPVIPVQMKPPVMKPPTPAIYNRYAGMVLWIPGKIATTAMLQMVTAVVHSVSSNRRKALVPTINTVTEMKPAMVAVRARQAHPLTAVTVLHARLTPVMKLMTPV